MTQHKDDKTYLAGVSDALALMQLAKQMGAEVSWPGMTPTVPKVPLLPRADAPSAAAPAPTPIGRGTIPEAAKAPFIGWAQSIPVGQEVSQQQMGALVGFRHPLTTGQKRCVAILATEDGLFDLVEKSPGNPKTMNVDGCGYRVFRRTPLLTAR